MTREEIFTKVVEIVRPFAKDKDALSGAKLETNILDDLKVNSARLVDVILEFEDEFDIEIPDKDAGTMGCVQDAIAYIESHVTLGSERVSAVTRSKGSLPGTSVGE